MKQASACCVLLLVTALTAACGESLSSGDYLRKAEARFADGDHAAAIVELKNALQRDAENADARVLLGLIYSEAGNYEGAQKELQKALENGATSDVVLPVLSKVLLALGLNQELMALRIDDLTDEHKSIVLAAQGISELERGNASDAELLVNQALAYTPRSPFVLVAKAKSLLAGAKSEEALATVMEALEADPKFAPAWSTLGDLEAYAARLKQSDEAYGKAIDLSNDQFSNRMKRAIVRLRMENVPLAQQDIDYLSKKYPGQPGVHFVQGMIDLREQKMDAARASFEHAVRADKVYPFAYFYLAAINLQQGRLAQAENYISQFLAVDDKSAVGHKLAATIKVQQGDFKGAERLINQALFLRKDDLDAVNMLADVQMRQGKTDESLDTLARAATIAPDSSSVQARMGAALLQSGDEAAGIEYLEKALHSEPAFQQAEALLIVNLLQKGQVDDALRLATDFRDRNPDGVTSYSMLGRVYIAANDFQQAKNAFEKSISLSPGDPAANHGLAYLELREGDYDSAIDCYNRVLREHKDYLPTLMKLASLEASRNEIAPMLQYLERAIAAHPEELEPRLVLGRFELSRGNNEKVLSLLDPLDESSKRRPDVLNVTAAAQFALKQYVQARRTSEQLVAIEPAVGRHRYNLAMALAATSENDKMLVELERAVALDPDALDIRLAFARALLLAKKTEEFKSQLTLLRTSAPDSVDVMRLEGYAASLAGDTKNAATLLEKILNERPSEEAAVELALAKRRNGDIDAATRVLEQWLDEHPDGLLSRIALADIYGGTGKIELAIKHYRLALEKDGNNFAALNNLAWHLRKQNPAQALKYAERAVELNPESAAALDTLALVQLQNNQAERAQSSIARALDAAPGNPTMRYHEAMIKSALGDKKAAIRILETLVSSNSGFPEMEESRTLLESLK